MGGGSIWAGEAADMAGGFAVGGLSAAAGGFNEVSFECTSAYTGALALPTVETFGAALGGGTGDLAGGGAGTGVGNLGSAFFGIGADAGAAVVGAGVCRTTVVELKVSGCSALHSSTDFTPERNCCEKVKVCMICWMYGFSRNIL